VASLSAGQLVKQQQAAPPSALAQHCAKCHSGPTPEAGLTYDGTALECWQVTSALRQIAKRAMPKDHQLTPDVKGQIMQELLDLESRSPLPGELK
jgi:hypothetical protein